MGIDISQLEMPAVSAEGLRVLELIGAEEPDFRLIEHTILRDPVLAGTVIRYANSPLYRRREKITNVPAAARLLGLRNLRAAVVMASLRAVTREDDPVSRRILNHSLDIALLARYIAARAFPALGDDLEFLGLIHDLGMLVLAANFPQRYGELMERSEREGVPMSDLEREAFGIRHDELIRRAGKHFRLPESFTDRLRSFHGRPPLHAAENDSERCIASLALAHRLLPALHPDTPAFTEAIPETQNELMLLLGLDRNAVETILGHCTERLEAAGGC